jgi:hypothetical protein
MGGISCLAEKQYASHVYLCCMQSGRYPPSFKACYLLHVLCPPSSGTKRRWSNLFYLMTQYITRVPATKYCTMLARCFCRNWCRKTNETQAFPEQWMLLFTAVCSQYVAQSGFKFQQDTPMCLVRGITINCPMRDFRLPLPCRWDLHSSGILRSVEWFYTATFSSWTSWPLTMGRTGCPKTSVHNYHSTLCKISEKHRLNVQSFLPKMFGNRV